MKIVNIAPDLGIEEINAVKRVIKAGKLSVFSSEEVCNFENEFAKYFGVKHAIALNSGTAALHTAILSLNLTADDEVIVPCFSYMATANAVLNSGPKISFVDISLKNFGISIEKLKNSVTKKTRAIVIVHMFGSPVDMNEIIKFAKERNLFVVEDCAQSLGSKTRERYVGTYGDFGCFSFQESKNMTTGGEGGMLITNDSNLARIARIIAHEGEITSSGKSTTIDKNQENHVDYIVAGHNFRLSAIQAAIGREQLKKLSSFITKRRAIAESYDKALQRYAKYLVLPKISVDDFSTFNNYVILVKDNDLLNRDIIVALLASKGIYAYPYYPNKLSDSKYLKEMYSNIRFPETDYFCANHFTLPINSKMNKKQIDYITKCLGEILGGLVKC